jgi:hypothetical protein
MTVVMTTLLLTACAAPEDPSQARTDREVAALGPLQSNSEGVITGLDVNNDTTLVVSIDLEQWSSVDEQDVAGFQAQALVRWKSTWSHEHPGHHALLRVVFADYHGRSVFTESVKT